MSLLSWFWLTCMTFVAIDAIDNAQAPERPTLKIPVPHPPQEVLQEPPIVIPPSENPDQRPPEAPVTPIPVQPTTFQVIEDPTPKKPPVPEDPKLPTEKDLPEHPIVIPHPETPDQRPPEAPVTLIQVQPTTFQVIEDPTPKKPPVPEDPKLPTEKDLSEHPIVIPPPETPAQISPEAPVTLIQVQPTTFQVIEDPTPKKPPVPEDPKLPTEKDLSEHPIVIPPPETPAQISPEAPVTLIQVQPTTFQVIEDPTPKKPPVPEDPKLPTEKDLPEHPIVIPPPETPDQISPEAPVSLISVQPTTFQVIEDPTKPPKRSPRPTTMILPTSNPKRPPTQVTLPVKPDKTRKPPTKKPVDPRFEEKCICEAHGDPHYKTFDNTTFSLLDDCSFIMAQAISKNGVCDFRVEVENELRPTAAYKKRAYTNLVKIFIGKEVITIGQGKIVKLNGKETSLPHDEESFLVRRIGKHVTLTTPCGLKVDFDGDSSAHVMVPKLLFGGHLSGLCGNCDGKSRTDWLPGTLRLRQQARVTALAKKFAVKKVNRGRYRCRAYS